MKKTIKSKPANTQHEILDLIAQRWSPRMFKQEKVDGKELNQLFEAARWAASSNNYQPWRFIYAHRGSEAFDKMYDCLAEFNQKWVKFAPVLVLTAIKEKFDSGKENYHALHDLGLAIGNLSIQAQHLGLAVHQMAGVDWKKTHEKFDVPDGYHVVSAVAIGYFGGAVSELPEDMQKMEAKERQRKSLSEILAEGKWPEEKK